MQVNIPWPWMVWVYPVYLFSPPGHVFCIILLRAVLEEEAPKSHLDIVKNWLPSRDWTYCWWFWNPVNSPVEVGSLSHLFTGFLYIPGGCFGFLPSAVALQNRWLQVGKTGFFWDGTFSCIFFRCENVTSVREGFEGDSVYSMRFFEVNRGHPWWPKHEVDSDVDVRLEFRIND